MLSKAKIPFCLNQKSKNQQLKINTVNNKNMYKSIINILDKPKLSKNDISLAWIKAKELDKTLK